jgi:DNA topoisomerase-1
VRAGAFRLLAEAHLKRGGFTVESAPQTVAALASLRDNKVSSRWIELAGVSLTKGGEACENCGSPMVIKLGRFGQFLACSTYPECRTTREMPAPNPAEAGAAAGAPPAEALCELCGKPMVEKRGRFGLFLGCTGYPECRNIRGASKKAGGVAPAPVPIAGETCPLDGSGLVRRQSPYGEIVSCARHPVCKYVKRETTGVACPRPGCGGEVLVKKSKRGKYFYGCSEYPKCDTVYWDKPVAVPCPRCNAPFLLEKTKGGSVVRRCAREDCRYESGRLGTASANRESRVGSDGGDARRPYH